MNELHITAQRGFTLFELQAAVAVFVIATSIGAMTAQSAIPMLRADSQLQRIVAALRQARELAVASRRDVEIRFVDDTRMDIVRLDDDEEVLALSVTFEYGVRFTTWDGMPDTPDGFGADAAIDFGDAAALVFISDGTLTDERGVPISGTIFLGMEGAPPTARAISVTGPTARARAWRWLGDRWGAR